MNNIFDWEEEWEWEKWSNIAPIPNQLSFFSPGENFLKSSEDKNNILFSSFEDIIYKNPAYTIHEMQYLHSLASEMD